MGRSADLPWLTMFSLMCHEYDNKPLADRTPWASLFCPELLGNNLGLD